MSLRPAAPALLAAMLFGASTPLAKVLGVAVSPFLLAGLLYLGSGLGLAVLLVLRRMGPSAEGTTRGYRIPVAELPWLLAAVVAGGIAGPVLLMAGLQSTPAASAALLLNLEGVLTAVIAWVVFRENAGRRVVLGLAAIVAGGALLAWQPGSAAPSLGALLVSAACLCWALDNNLTRKVSGNDAMLIACIKGLVAGGCNTALAIVFGAALPTAGVVAATLLLGFFGYGLSLVLFVVSLRTLGTTRTDAYFSVAPFLGVLIAFAIWPALPTWTFWAAALLMASGVVLHLSERHGHLHTHETLEHDHPHVHDAHHRHMHDFPVARGVRHVHRHRHTPLTHGHAHYPDIHHRHGH